MARKKKQKQNKENQDSANQANVHSDLKGLEININPFGEIETNYDIKEINKFLNKHVDDKKLKEREELKKKGLAKDQQLGKTSENEEKDEEQHSAGEDENDAPEADDETHGS